MLRTVIGFLLGSILGGVGGPLGTFIYQGVLRPKTQSPEAFRDALIGALRDTPLPLIAGAVGGGLFFALIFALVGGGSAGGSTPKAAASRWPSGFELLCEALSRAYPEGVPPLERRPLGDLLMGLVPAPALPRVLVAALGPKHGLTLSDPSAGHSSEDARSVVRERLRFFGYEEPTQ